MAAALLGELGLDPGLVAEAIADPTTHDDVRAEHERVVAAGGFGVPTLFFPDGAVPVRAGRRSIRRRATRPCGCGSTCCAWRDFPHLFEIKRPEDGGRPWPSPTRSSPYLEARDWMTIEHPAP